MSIKLELSEQQQIAFDKYIDGVNIFITGPGGSGKSVLIKKIQEHAYKNNKDVAVCALTGCAALLLDCHARTIHSWAGIGIGKETIEKMVTRINNNSFKRGIWKKIDVLIVDEVSMLSQKLFEMLDAIGKVTRKQMNKPFGGIQVIFSGDFYQLPPVEDKDEPETKKFCFESPLWFQTFKRFHHVQLIKIFRQSDTTYSSILNQIREGKLKRSSNNILLNYVGREINPNMNILPTKLYPTKNKVQQINNTEINKLNTPFIDYKIKYILDLAMSNQETIKRMSFTQEQIMTELKHLQGNLLCEETLKIKIGAQVMCIINLDMAQTEICNGSQGIIVGIKDNGNPIVKFANGYTSEMSYHIWKSDIIPGIGVSQIPLILSWALTIHKSQGATLEAAEIDVGSKIFECGQTYVALSRVKSLDGLYLTSFDASRIMINKKVKDFYTQLNEKTEILPVAQAVIADIPICIATPINNNIEEISEEDYID